MVRREKRLVVVVVVTAVVGWWYRALSPLLPSVLPAAPPGRFLPAYSPSPRPPGERSSTPYGLPIGFYDKEQEGGSMRATILPIAIILTNARRAAVTMMAKGGIGVLGHSCLCNS